MNRAAYLVPLFTDSNMSNNLDLIEFLRSGSEHIPPIYTYLWSASDPLPLHLSTEKELNSTMVFNTGN
jgi:hypothetical protein